MKAPKFEPANEFLTILEDSVAKLSSGVMTVDQCVMLYPNYAEPLKLILQTTFFLRLGYGLQPSSTFIAYTRAALLQHMWSHPRQQKKVVVMPFGQRMAVTLAMLFAALLATGTAHAQSALPGDNFYPWKRTSEQVWRTLSLDPVATDIAIANRRVVEMVAVADDPVLSASARDGYFEVLNRLSSVDDVPTLATILPALVTQEAALSDAGVVIPELEDLLVVVTNAIPDEVLAQLTTTATATSTLTTTPEFTFTPTSTPTEQPTDTPTMTPTPTDEPTNTPTMSPTATDEPTDTPTMTPTATDEPTNTPTDEPTLTPTDTPTDEPTLTPTYTPTDEPTITPTDTLDPSLIPADGLP
ncbi:MAG: hypothetical protein U0Z26_02360 [Anaerolineales bacterium]